MILQIDPGLFLVLIRETAVLFAIYGIYVLSLNLEVGYLGLPQFGKVMFLALGGLAVGGHHYENRVDDLRRYKPSC